MTYYFDISGGSKTGSTLREMKRLLAFLGDGCPTLQRDCDEAEGFEAMKGHEIGWRITLVSRGDGAQHAPFGGAISVLGALHG